MPQSEREFLLTEDTLVTDEDGGTDFIAVPDHVPAVAMMRTWMYETGLVIADLDGVAGAMAMAREVKQGWMRPVSRDDDMREWVGDGNRVADHPWFWDAEYLWRVCDEDDVAAQAATYWSRA